MQGKLEPQAYINALRKGSYVFASLGLGTKIYNQYQSFSKKALDGDDVTPLLTNLFAETDITIEDLALIKLGILSNEVSKGSGEAMYYLTQLMSAAAELLSHEAWLKEQEGNQDKSPKDIRQMVRDEIREAFKRENGLKEAEQITEGKMSAKVDPGVLVEKETTYRKALNYAVNHLINENKILIHETGNLLIARLDKVEAKIVELDRRADAGKGDAKRIMELRIEARRYQREVEDHLSLLLVQPKNFKANKALSWVMDQGSLQEVKQQIESYLEFLNNHPIEEPWNNQRLLKTYDARKYAAAMMLTAIKTASLRPPGTTLAILQDNARTIKNNRPGLWELGIVAWIIDCFIKKSEMTKITDTTLKITKAEIKKLGTKDSFFYNKASGPEAASEEVLPRYIRSQSR